MGANCNVTPQLKNFLYYRFDLTKKTPLPKFYGCKLQRYTSRSLQTQQKPRVTEAQHNAEKHFLFI